MRKLLFLLLVAGILLFGCVESQSLVNNTAGTLENEAAKNIGGPKANETGISANATSMNESVPAAGISKTNETQKTDLYEAKTVLMLGRSVTNGWMEYFGAEYVCADEECSIGTYEANYSGYRIIYYEMETPPQIIASAIGGLDEYGNMAETVFFKLCFDDFESDESGDNLKRNEGYVESIYNEVVVKRNKTLIVGNALPKVSEYTDQELVSNHRAYNQWLDGFARTHKDMEVLDLYGILSEPDGSLKSPYSLDQYDSHLNNAAYSQISPKFLDLLEKD